MIDNSIVYFLVDCQWGRWSQEEGCPICYKNKHRSYGEIEVRGNGVRNPVPEFVFDKFDRIMSRYSYDKDKGIERACGENSDYVALCSKR